MSKKAKPKLDPESQPGAASASPASSADAPALRVLASGAAVDKRTALARWVAEAKHALSTDLRGSAVAVLRHQAAVNLALARVVTDFLLAHPEAALSGGRLSPLLGDDLAKLQAQTRQILAALEKLEGGKDGGKDSAGPKVADLVLAADDDEPQESAQ